MTKKDRQFRPVPVPSVVLGGLFGARQDAVCNATAETLLDRCVEAGMVKAIDVDQPMRTRLSDVNRYSGTTRFFGAGPLRIRPEVS